MSCYIRVAGNPVNVKEDDILIMLTCPRKECKGMDCERYKECLNFRNEYRTYPDARMYADIECTTSNYWQATLDFAERFPRKETLSSPFSALIAYGYNLCMKDMFQSKSVDIDEVSDLLKESIIQQCEKKTP